LVDYIDGGLWPQIGGDIQHERDVIIEELYSVALTEDGSKLFIGEGSEGKVSIYNYSDTNDTYSLSDEFNVGERFGQSLAVSGDGNIFIAGNYFNEAFTGMATVYELVSGTWNQKGTSIFGEVLGDFLGYSVSISGDGDRIAIGVPYFDPNDEFDTGIVQTFEWDSETSDWAKFGGNIVGEAAGDRSGINIAMSKDGNSVAIAATFNDGEGTNQRNTGQVRVYACSITLIWTQQGGDIDGLLEYSGNPLQVDISADGRAVVVGYPSADDDKGNVVAYELVQTGTILDEINNNLGIDIDFDFLENFPILDPILADPGLVIVSEWSQYGDVLTGEASGDLFGSSVSMSDDSTAIFIGAPQVVNSTHAGVGLVFSYNEQSETWDFASSDSSTEAFNTAMSGDGHTIATLSTSFTQIFKFRFDSESPSLSPTTSRPPSLAPSISNAPTINVSLLDRIMDFLTNNAQWWWLILIALPIISVFVGVSIIVPSFFLLVVGAIVVRENF